MRRRLEQRTQRILLVAAAAVALVGVALWWVLDDTLERMGNSSLWDDVEAALVGPFAEDRRDPVRGPFALMPVSRTDGVLTRWYTSPEGAWATTERLSAIIGITPAWDEARGEGDSYRIAGRLGDERGGWYVSISIHRPGRRHLGPPEPASVPDTATTLVSVSLSGDP